MIPLVPNNDDESESRTINETCPLCFYAIYGQAEPVNTDATPSPGDLVLCPNCGTWLQFTVGMTFRIFPSEAKSALPEGSQEGMSKVEAVWKEKVTQEGKLFEQERAQRQAAYARTRNQAHTKEDAPKTKDTPGLGNSREGPDLTGTPFE